MQLEVTKYSVKTKHMQPAVDLWRLFTLVELFDNMKQQSDTTFIDIWIALCVAEMKSEHIAALKDKVRTNFTHQYFLLK